MNQYTKIGIWSLVLLISLIVLSWTRPYVDISYTEPMRYSSGQMKLVADSIWKDLGATDEYLKDRVIVEYAQRRDYLLQETGPVLEERKKLSFFATEKGQDLNLWRVSALQDTVGRGLESANGQAPRAQAMYDGIGMSQFTLNSSGRVLKYDSKPNFAIGKLVAENIDEYINRILPALGYDANEYEVLPEFYSAEGFEIDSLKASEIESTDKDTLLRKRSLQLKSIPSINHPKQIDIEIQHIIGDARNNQPNSFSLVSFSTLAEVDESVIAANAEGSENIELISFIFCLVLIAVFGIIAALIPIIKGRVDWKQVLITFLLFTAAMAFWRNQVLFRYTFGYIDWGELFLRFFNEYVVSVIVGAFASMIYLGWSNLARDQKQKGFRLINEFWHFRFNYRETGAGLFKGIAFGISILALLFLGSYITRVFLFNYEGGTFNTTEMSSFFPPLTIFTSAYTVTWIAGIGSLALVYSLIFRWTKSILFSALLTTLTFIPTGTFFLRYMGTSGPFSNDMLIFTPIAVLAVLFFIRQGIFALLVAFFCYSSLVHTLPLLNMSAGAIPLTNGSVIAGFHGLLFFVGIVLYLRSPSVKKTREELPDYERKFQTQQRLVKEIEVARLTQMQLMPDHNPRLEGADIYGFFMPSFEVGGDYYYYYKLEQDGKEQLAFTLLDVSGKAMRAAIQAVFTSGLLMSRMSSDSPDDILDAISPMVYEHTDARTFITCIVGRYDTQSRKLNFANAGHCMPLLKRGNEAQFIETQAPRFPLGMKKEVDYIAETIQLEPGDTFILYSDGFPEAEDRLRNRIGFKGIQDFVAQLPTESKSSREIAELIKSKIMSHSGTDLADDTTVIVIKIEPNEATA